MNDVLIFAAPILLRYEKRRDRTTKNRNQPNLPSPWVFQQAVAVFQHMNPEDPILSQSQASQIPSVPAPFVLDLCRSRPSIQEYYQFLFCFDVDWIRVVICDTRARRELLDSEYSERRAQCEQGAVIIREFYPEVTALRDVSLQQLNKHRRDLPVTVAKRCQFIIEEMQRALEMGEALRLGSDSIGNLTHASYIGARDLYEIGSPEMESMMSAMMDCGVPVLRPV